MTEARPGEPCEGKLSAWTRLLARVTPSCETVTRLVSESCERPLGPGERLRLRLHFSICVWCLRFHDQVRALHQGLARHADRFTDTTAGALPDDARARIKALLAAQAGAAELPRVRAVPARAAWALRFALVPPAAYLLALASQWCIHCVEVERIGGAALRIAHLVLSWPFLAGRAAGLFTETPAGFPMCCFVGWTAAGLLAVAAWALLTRAAPATRRA